jgi:hypothetical protein
MSKKKETTKLKLEKKIAIKVEPIKMYFMMMSFIKRILIMERTTKINTY